MQLWHIEDDHKRLRKHTVPAGFGHSLLLSTLISTFEFVAIGASLWREGLWWSIHGEPNVTAFEVEHGAEDKRVTYNRNCFAQLKKRLKTVRGDFAGHCDYFVPVLVGRRLLGALVVGPFMLSRPTSTEILERWRALTGRQGHLADPEFNAYLRSSLSTLVLDGGKAAAFERLLECIAELLSGQGAADDAVNRAQLLRAEVEEARFVEHVWEVTRTMLDHRSSRIWYSAHNAFELRRAGLSRIADHLLVGLTSNRVSKSDGVDEAIRRDAFQRAVVELAQETGDVLAGKVGEHGIVFLSGQSGSAQRKRQKVEELAERAAKVARRRFGLSLHLGVSLASRSIAIASSYQAALGAAESALAQGKQWVLAEPGLASTSYSLRRLRDELSHVVEEHPELLSPRFERYIEAVSAQSGYRVDAARGFLEAGFERIATRLVGSGSLDDRSFSELRDVLDRAAATAQTLSDLLAAYRTAVADVAQAVQHSVPARQDRNLRAAVDYIHQHYGEALSFRKVARVAGFNPNYFSELFRKREHMTFEKYVRGVRLERAKQLLSSTELAVGRIATLCGFTSARYFRQVFRAAIGTRPLEYRTRARRQMKAPALRPTEQD